MSRNQFLAVVALLVVLGAAALGVWRSERAGWGASEVAIGQRVVPGLAASAVAQLRIVDRERTLVLERGPSGWSVAQRDGLPADVGRIGELLVRLVELKVVQAEPFVDAQRARLGLVEPAAGASDAGTRLELRDDAGKTLASLLLGRTVRRGSGAEAVPSGRYLLTGERAATVVVVADPMLDVDPRTAPWISKEGVRIEQATSIVATGGDGRTRFALSRDAQAARAGGAPAAWKLGDGATAPDPAKAGDVVGALAQLRPLDVPDPAPPLERPTVVRVATADGPTYTLTIGAATKSAAGEDAHPVRIEIAGEPARERPKPDGESQDDATKAEQAWTERLKALDARLAAERRIAGRTLLVAKSSVDPLLREAAQLVPEPKPAAQPRPGGS